MDAVLFDLDDTLCTYRRHGREVLAKAYETVGVEPFFSVEGYYAIYDDYTDRADTIDELREQCFEALAESNGRPPAVGRQVAQAFAADRDHRDVVFLDGAAEALDAIADDYRVGLVTNGAPGMQSEKLDALGIRHRFETIVHGGHDAPAKPSAEPFYAALEPMSVPPGRAVHIGNSLSSDVAGANNAGVGSVWLRNGATVDEDAPDYTVDSLTELLDPPWR